MEKTIKIRNRRALLREKDKRRAKTWRNIRIEQSTWEWLKHLSEEEEVAMNEVIRGLLRRYVSPDDRPLPQNWKN